MKKTLMILGGVFLVLIVGFVGLLVWAHRAGSAHQEKFFQAVLSGDPKQVTALFHPALRDEVDEPVLAVWMKAVKDNLGAFQGLNKTDFNTSSKIEGGATIGESKGTVSFEKGQAQSELKTRDGQIVAFHVTSDKLGGDWFKGPTDTTLYRQRGKECLTYLLGDKCEDAFKMMHENLQKKVPLDQLKAMMADFTGKAGKAKTVTYQSETLEPGGTLTLKVVYKVECEKANPTGTVEFQFDGLKGHLVAFNLK
jgi:hypothetical protein